MMHSKTIPILTALALLSGCGGEVATRTPAIPTPTVTPATVGAPEPVSPEDGIYFVDSDVTLKWDWPPGLGRDQTYAVQVWFNDLPAQEIWTGSTSLNIKQAIDSFGRDVGPFHWKVVVINASAQKGFQGTASAWSPVQTLNRVRRIIPTPLPESEMSDSAKYVLAQNLPSDTGRIDFARHYINIYSIYGKPEPGKPDRSDTLEKLYLHSQGKGPAPVIECDGLSTMMLTLLKELGIESRLIFLYANGGTGIGEHTVLEVFNPDTQHWEVQDPTNDVYFVDTTTNQRASIARLVFGSMDTIRPCDGCNAEKAAKAAAHFQAYRIGYTDTFYVNPDRFDVSQRFRDEHNHNLAEYLTGNAADFTFMFAPPPDSY